MLITEISEFCCVLLYVTSAAAQCGGIFNNYLIANCPENVPVKEF